jgi:putative ATP-dependent endonuclease of OLD family
LDARAEDDVEKAISLFKNAPSLRMGPSDGYQSSLERQGSGARRTLLWTALRILAEHKRLPEKKGDAVSDRPHLLLLDEPEMCLHPNAIRDACNVLYSLPTTNKWQVMVTTHSPVFIDLSRDNTSIVRVERDTGGEVTGTTIYRPTKAKLSPDEKEELKLLNMYDPHVAEFFFGGRTVVVEGDTEHSAFKEIIQAEKERFKDVHVVRARGKYTIVALCKILNQFGNPYAVLHDADTPTIMTKRGEVKNPAWAANQQIKDVAAEAPRGAVVIASLPNFEVAMFGRPAKGEKPYAAWEKVRKNAGGRAKVAQLLSCLVDGEGAPPAGTFRWGTPDELATAVSVYLKTLEVAAAADEVEAAMSAATEDTGSPVA